MSEPAIVDTYPLSPLQQGMLFHYLEGTNVGVDIEQMVGELHEPVDTVALERAWQRIADRHAVLRTQYEWVGLDEPAQHVLDRVEVSLVIHDLRELDPAEQRARFDTFMVQDRSLGFKLERAPLWRVTLFQLAESEQIFVFTYHHSLLDISVVWVVAEAFQVYDAEVHGHELNLLERLPYRDHITWLQGHLAENSQSAKEYFQQLLQDFDEPTRLSALERRTDAGQPAVGYGAMRFRLSEILSATLRSRSAELGIGLPVFVEAAWGLVLSAFSGSTDVVFGSTRGARRSGLAGSDTIVGLFINTPPVRIQLDPDQTVTSLLGAVRQQQVEKRAYEHTPLTDIQAAMDTRGAGLFDTIVVINELHQGTRLKASGDAFANRDFDLHDQTNFPLTLLAFTDPQIHFKLSYDHRVFEETAMDRVRELLCQVLEAIAENPDRPVSELPRIPDRERSVLAAWNSTARDYPTQVTIHELFEAQVDRTPDATALVFRSQQLTYRELDARANEVAALLREFGVGPDTMVGVFIERSVEMMVGLLGILKAGGAYVPMDPAYPAVRIAMMLEDAHADIVLTHSRLAPSVPAIVSHVVALDQLRHRPAERAAVPDLHSNHLAYVIFTSGSTGRPKGVMVEHRNVVNFFTAMDEQLGHDSSQEPGVWLAVTSISFDISVLELFWTLTRGFTLVLQQDDNRRPDDSAEIHRATAVRPMDFSLFYFAADAEEQTGNRYRLLIEGAKFADQNGFAAVWTPERHFHEFGGIYPNPALTSVAVAMVTERISIRAGSIVLPLHNPVTLAEDWSVVDNLSNGRVGLSFASGWHANDFALAPDNFTNRRALMAEGIETIRSLWRGESVAATSGDGRDISVRIFPPPVQTAPGIWITAGGSPDTFAMAGRIGASILTNLLVMGHDDLVKNIAAYRDAYRAAGHPGDGHISVMLHTFVGSSMDEVRDKVREPFLEYLRTSTDLINQVKWEQTSFAKPDSQRAPGEGARDLAELSDEEMAVIMDHAFERYFQTAGLFGTPDTCLEIVERLRGLGVDEIACLIDFGVDESSVLAGLVQLDTLRQVSNRNVVSGADASTVGAEDSDSSADTDDDGVFDLVSQVERHGVTHLQCTPSLAGIIAALPDGIDALAKLDKLLLGGEALPPALVDRIRPDLQGELLNMYGPTETTIWSTVSPILAAEVPITIGRPIANTQIFIVDRNLQPNPIGVAGELLIGGDGVVRGYLDRPELTGERFVQLRDGGARVYRTGDLACLRPDGEIEFSGRLDHQVKIRGYRIELGEIEAAIGRFPDTFENVVVARSDTPGEPRLVAYVVPRTNGAASSPDVWGELWNETYLNSSEQDATFDIAGWNDSYTGEPIPRDEMHEWVDATVSRIQALDPRRVLEVGCGTGLFLFRIAPESNRYVGIDLAQGALDRIAANLERRPLPHVSLIQGAAHDVSKLVDETFDTIVINSVAQYFPDADYFVDVVSQAMSLLEPGGSLFLGDLRSLAHLPMFAAAVELARASDDQQPHDVRERMLQRIAQEEELLIDPHLFLALKSAIPALGRVDVRLKAGRYENELTRFRYDVVLRRTSDQDAPAVQDVRTLSLDEFSIEAVKAALHDEPDVLRVDSIRNARLVQEAELVQMLSTESAALATVADLRAALRSVNPGVHPQDLVGLDDRYETSVVWSEAGPDRFDLILRSRSNNSHQPTEFVDAREPWTAYTNQPAQRGTGTLGPDLRAHLRASLPDYMVPTAIVVLDSLPRTPNGKIDRNSLPAPDRSRTEGVAEAVAPENDFERMIDSVWQNMLSLDAVGVETNLFDLGANSLMMVQASSRLTEALGRRVSLVDMFRFPTVRTLAAHLGGGERQEAAAMLQSQNRAQTRKDAMLKRRDARQGARPDRKR